MKSPVQFCQGVRIVVSDSWEIHEYGFEPLLEVAHNVSSTLLTHHNMLKDLPSIRLYMIELPTRGVALRKHDVQHLMALDYVPYLEKMIL